MRSLFILVWTVLCWEPHGSLFVSSFLSRPISTFVKRGIAQPALLPPVVCWSSKTDGFAEAGDGDAVQLLFNKYCDKDGLMTISVLKSVPAIAELLEGEDLLDEELREIWDKAPKFPDVDASVEKIDVDSFVQIYRDIDDLFEDDEDDETADTTLEQPEVERDDTLEEELEGIYESICNEDGLVSKKAVLEWDEVQTLLQDGLLGRDEFEDIWEKTPKTPGSDQLDIDGFLSFNVALDGLFEIEDEEEDLVEPEEETVVSTSKPQELPTVDGDDLSPKALFAALADENKLVGMPELKRWGELREMLRDGELLPLELQNIFENITKSPENPKKLNEDGFMALYEEIDSLFEDYDEDEEAEESTTEPLAPQTKSELLELLSELNDDDEVLPCGLESTEAEQQLVMKLVKELEQSPTNLIKLKKGAIEVADITGSWDLLYSSSSAMKFNKGLSGLGGSFPNGRFGGLRQNLQGSKFLSDAEYIEKIEVEPSSASFEVRVDGNWDLTSSVSLFTGEPAVVLTIEPGSVTYGPTSTKADHWKSLGPMNMLDISYLDEDLRIMRGSTAVDTLFIFKRAS